MQINLTGQPVDNRLRLIFEDTEVSFRLAPDVTFGELAQAFNALSRQHDQKPVAIDVIMGGYESASKWNSRQGQ